MAEVVVRLEGEEKLQPVSTGRQKQESMKLYINQELTSLEAASDQTPVQGSFGWYHRTWEINSATGLTIHEWGHASGLTHWDAINRDVYVMQVHAESGHYFGEIYPNAGLAVTTGVPVLDGWISTPFKEKLSTGEWIPDKRYTGITGSPRNGMSSWFWAQMKDKGFGYELIHQEALEYLKFQRRRAYQLNIHDYHAAEVLDGQPIWRYDAHHMAVQEEAGIYELSRDPRAYDLVKRLVTHAGTNDWYLKEGGNLNDNSRVKGWWLAALGRAWRMSGHANDENWREQIVAWIESARDRINEQWDLPGRVTPSSQAPDGRHIKDCWSDTSWMVAILAHGAHLAGEWEIRDRALAAIDRYFFDGSKLYVDICSDGLHPDKWIPYTSPTGTCKWIAQAFIQAGLTDSAVLRFIQDWRASLGKEPYTFEDYTS